VLSAHTVRGLARLTNNDDPPPIDAASKLPVRADPFIALGDFLEMHKRDDILIALVLLCGYSDTPLEDRDETRLMWKQTTDLCTGTSLRSWRILSQRSIIRELCYAYICTTR
jgi:hypothetical protein